MKDKLRELWKEKKHEEEYLDKKVYKCLLHTEASVPVSRKYFLILYYVYMLVMAGALLTHIYHEVKTI